MTKKQKRKLYRILAAVILFTLVHFLTPDNRWLALLLYLIPYGFVGYDILLRAGKNIVRGQVFDENFLMALASVGAFCIGEYAEGVAVMLFYQIGELFENCAVTRSRRSIVQMMDICPEYANIEREGQLMQLDPAEVAVGDIITVKAGEKIPLDGVITDGTSHLDTAALTGESMPLSVREGDTVTSGCINQTGLLHIRVTKPYENSTVQKIVALVENASSRKAHAEQFITKFARYYTPAVVIGAVLLAVIPSFITGQWSAWIRRALIFLVVSCPCALVISVPLTFFGGIGGASRRGILVKGGSFLEVLSRAETVVFDKTGTLTEGAFRVSAVCPTEGDEEALLSLAAYAEAFSDHPIASSIRAVYGKEIDTTRVKDVTETAGYGIRALFDGKELLVGNERMMEAAGVDFPHTEAVGTVVHVAADGAYFGYIVIADTVKTDAQEAIALLKSLGVRRTVMLSGDSRKTAESVADALGIDEVYGELLPADKMDMVEKLIAETGKGSLVFVGDGINDAPSLMRADVGIAMGAMGTDAAIEAADVVLMNDRPTAIPRSIRLSRRTMQIVWQNIVFALSVKGIILLLGALGYAGMWAAVFADVGVSVLAILNAMRALRRTE